MKRILHSNRIYQSSLLNSFSLKALICQLLILFSIFTLALFVCLSGAQASEVNKCIQLFQFVQLDDAQLKTWYMLNENEKYESLKFKGEIPFAGGGALRLIENEGKTWSSTYQESKNDPLGSPLQFPLIVGSRVAAVFGFLKESEKSIFVPDAKALMATIKILNAKLMKLNLPKMSVKFYETTTEKTVSNETYLENFITSAGIPLEKNGALGIHDVSYHISALLIPEWAIKRLQISANWTLKFAKYLQAQSNPQAHRLAEAVLSNAATRIDYLGNISVILAVHKHQTAPVPLTNFLNHVVEFTGTNLSPYDFLQLNSSYLFGGTKYLYDFIKTDAGSVIHSNEVSMPTALMDEKLNQDLEINIENLKKVIP